MLRYRFVYQTWTYCNISYVCVVYTITVVTWIQKYVSFPVTYNHITHTGLWYQPQHDVYVYAMLIEVIRVFPQSLEAIFRLVYYITEAGIAPSL
jgi:hypothetical protein